MTANQTYFDLQLRYQHRLRQLASRILGRATELVSYSDRQLLQLLRRKLPVLRRGKFDFAAKQFLALMDELEALRRKDLDDTWAESMVELKELAYMTQDKEEERTLAAIPFRLTLGRIAPALVLVSLTEPFAGGPVDARTLPQWLESIQAADATRIRSAVQLGIRNNLPTAELAGMLAGTKAKGFSDGVLAATRRNFQAVLASGITHIHNSVSEKFWNRNPQVYRYLQWVAILDGRTSAICRARDGKFAPLGKNKVPDGVPKLDPPGARPPAHVACRSVMSPVFDANGIASIIGERPFFRETSKVQFDKINFRAQARANFGNSDWRKLTEVERQRAVDSLRDKFVSEHIGTVAADLDYDDWLRTQPVKFQDEVLGQKKAVLFRKGLKIDKFVDRAGRELTIPELRKLLE